MANHHFNSIVEASHRGASFGCGRTAFRFGASAAALVVASAFVAQPAAAQAAPPPNLVSVCSGVSLPRSAITDTVAPVIDGIVGPLEGAVNPLLGAVGLDIDTTTLLQQAAAGDPITLQVLNINGNVVGPDDRCDATADSISLDNPQGISIGGNRITGLGSVGEEAVAGEEDSIAFGNNAATDASSVGAIAIGTGAGVGAGSTGSIAFGAGSNATVANSIALGAGSVANRGALTGYQAPGLTAAQNSVGELSIGADGAERQITHVAAGTAPTDAVNMAQFEGVANSLDALSGLAVLYDGADHTMITLGGAAGTTITNLAPGNLSDTSTDAVNGSSMPPIRMSPRTAPISIRIPPTSPPTGPISIRTRPTSPTTAPISIATPPISPTTAPTSIRIPPTSPTTVATSIAIPPISRPTPTTSRRSISVSTTSTMAPSGQCNIRTPMRRRHRMTGRRPTT